MALHLSARLMNHGKVNWFYLFMGTSLALEWGSYLATAFFQGPAAGGEEEKERYNTFSRYDDKQLLQYHIRAAREDVLHIVQL